jgi:hypothetical protein
LLQLYDHLWKVPFEFDFPRNRALQQ